MTAQRKSFASNNIPSGLQSRKLSKKLKKKKKAQSLSQSSDSEEGLEEERLDRVPTLDSTLLDKLKDV